MHRNRIASFLIKIRTFIGLSSFFAFNSYLKGFGTGIFTGQSKRFCAPFINCHSCPSATFACPVGLTQHFFTYRHLTGQMVIPKLSLGFLILISLVMGKIFCGWLCPFGLIQTLLYKIKSFKIRIPHPLTHMKYAVFAFFIIFLPLYTGEPWFCKLCPVGSLEAGVPLVSFGAASLALREIAQALFSLKLSILLVFLFMSVHTQRPFCRLFCPIGALYSFFGRFSLIRVKLDTDACISCGLCEKVCPIELPIDRAVKSGNCFLCGECLRSCHKNALYYGLNDDVKILKDKFSKLFLSKSIE